MSAGEARERTIKLGVFDCTIGVLGGKAIVVLRDVARQVVASGGGCTVSDAMLDAASKAVNDDARRALQAAALPQC